MMMKRCIWLFVILLLLLASPVLSHEVRPSYLELIQQDKNTYSVLWKVPAKKKSLRLGLYVKFADGVENIADPVERFGDGSYIKQWRIRHDEALVNSRIYIEGLQATFTEVLVRIERLDGSVQISRLMPEKPWVVVEASPTVIQVAATYTRLGIKHIWEGIDHLLFLVSLILIAGTAKRILITITGFTLAHSVTLVLSALKIVTLSIAPVEAIIALSIVFLSTEIAKGRRSTLTWKYPLTVSASFGLLHGFGFAALLKEIGLPQVELATGLLFFNVGVEIGQLIFVFAVLFVIKALLYIKIDMRQPILQKPVAYCVGSLASFWLLQRSASFLL